MAGACCSTQHAGDLLKRLLDCRRVASLHNHHTACLVSFLFRKLIIATGALCLLAAIGAAVLLSIGVNYSTVAIVYGVGSFQTLLFSLSTQSDS
jgi:hypothetical protein